MRGAEIERKFLVQGSAWEAESEGGRSIRQYYLASHDRVSIRVRIEDDERASITIKSGAASLSRSEFEYSIPLADAVALAMLRRGSIIEKRRHDIRRGGAHWEIDVFAGDLAGLVLCEIELPDEKARFDRPAWLGREVTGDPTYYNARLAGADVDA